MKNRPKTYLFMGLVFLAIAVGLPVQIIALFHLSPSEIMRIYYLLTPVNALVMAVCIVNAILCWNASPWLRLTLPIGLALVAWNNYLVGAVGINYSMTLAWAGSLAFVALHGSFLAPSALALLRDPKKRWWLTAKRVPVACPVVFQTVAGQRHHGRLFDLSKSGAFIPLNLVDNWDRWRTTASKAINNEFLDLKLSLGRFKEITVQARVVRASPANGHYPEGIGIEFLEMSRDLRQDLLAYLEDAAESVKTPRAGTLSA